MTLDEIETQWAQDCKIDTLNLGKAAAEIPILHSRYYGILLRELVAMKNAEGQLKQLEKDKWMYYKGLMTKAELAARGWKEFDIKLMASDLDRFISSDHDLQQLKLKWTVAEEKVNFLKSILDSIKNRNFVVKNVIDWRRFEAGS